MTAYLANAAGPVPLVLDLHIAHEHWASSSDHSINGHLHYPNDLDRPLNEDTVDKIRQELNRRPTYEYRCDERLNVKKLFIIKR